MRKEIMKQKVGFLLSHPIQYFSPLFRLMRGNLPTDFTVYYCSSESISGLKETNGFGRKIRWDIDLLGGYSSVFLKNFSQRGTIYRPIWGLINLQIIPVLFHERFSLFVVHGWNYISYWLAFLSCIITGTKLGLRAENVFAHEVCKTSLSQRFKRVLLRRLFECADVLFATGEGNAEFYRWLGVPESKIVKMPYAVDNRTLIPAISRQRENRAALRDSLGFMEEDVVILFAGKLIDKKRPFDLLKAYEKISVANKGLLFVGDGILRRELEVYARENKIAGVSIVGFKNQTELPAYYAAADIFVLPSGMGETWGLVVNEAMCAGLPVVVSDLVGCALDLVEQGGNGYVYKCGDVDQLAEKLGTLIISTEARLRMGARSRQKIDFYSYTEDIRVLEGYLKSLPSRSERRSQQRGGRLHDSASYKNQRGG